MHSSTHGSIPIVVGTAVLSSIARNPEPMSTRSYNNVKTIPRNTNIVKNSHPHNLPQRRRINNVNATSNSTWSTNDMKHNMKRSNKASKSADDDQLIRSMNNLKIKGSKQNVARSTNPTSITTAKAIIFKYLKEWASQTYDIVGHGQQEKVYQNVLKNLLLQKGFDVSIEVPLSVLRRDQKTGTIEKIKRRADLVVSLPGQLDKVLIECKAKTKITKDDMSQVIFYRKHFGIDECYLVNFRPGMDVLRLREENVHVHPAGIPPSTTLSSAPRKHDKESHRNKHTSSSRSTREHQKSSSCHKTPNIATSSGRGVVVKKTDHQSSKQSRNTRQHPTQPISNQLNHAGSSSRKNYSMAITGLTESMGNHSTNVKHSSRHHVPPSLSKSPRMNIHVANSPKNVATVPDSKTGGAGRQVSTQTLKYRRQSLPTPTHNYNKHNRFVQPSAPPEPVIPSAPPEEDVLSQHRRLRNVVDMDRLRILSKNTKTKYHPSHCNR